MNMVIESPKPGSREATELGCSCGPINNDGGQGYRENPAWWLIRRDCPLHGIDGRDKLKQVLEAVEWSGGGVAAYARCPKCNRCRCDGHAPDCQLFLVLGKASER